MKQTYISVALVVVLLTVQLLTLPVNAAAVAAPAPKPLLINSIGSILADFGTMLLDGIKRFFIPRDDFFPRLADRLFNAFQAKFGGILSLANYLKTRFTDLRAYRGDFLILKFPSDYPLLGGRNIDLMAGAGGIADMIRGALSGFVVLCTAAFAYKRVVSIINA